MTKRTHTRILLAALGLGGAAAMAGLPAAHADPVDNYVLDVHSVVCQTLDAEPSFSGIEGVAMGIVKDTGWDYGSAGRVVKESVMVDCTRYIPLWNRFVATYQQATPEPEAPQRPQLDRAA